ncbi:hypothetical protein [Bifidobacterium castoris]|nr:hypothetical protein [Bifidobacterium castoris]
MRMKSRRYMSHTTGARLLKDVDDVAVRMIQDGERLHAAVSAVCAAATDAPKHRRSRLLFDMQYIGRKPIVDPFARNEA